MSSAGLRARGADPSLRPVLLQGELDVVVASADPALRFLQAWLPVLQPYHVIVVYHGPEAEAGSVASCVPPGLSCQVFTRHDVKKLLGQSAACISRDSACRCFGWLVSKKPYVLTFADDCVPLSDPGVADALRGSAVQAQGGLQLDPVARHCRNLCSPATPQHFNTLYDPFEDSTDFVRGYPFSLREGVPTAVSHGLWLNMPDYDAPTQLVKPNERNTRYVDAVQTVPKGALFPMSALNLAFRRDLVGLAMYFPPVAEGQPLGFHDDMWAGWCAKVICDHLGLGVKSGLPYVWRQRKASAFANLRREYKGIFWQEEIVPFFQGLQLPAEATTPEACYLEIAHQVKESLGKVDPAFVKLAEGMAMWVDAWKAFHP